MGWYEAMKDAFAVADRLRDAELKQRLAAVQMECAKLSEDNAKLRQDLTDLREQAKARQEMHFENNVYWRRLGTDKLEGPFCAKCFDGESKAARLSDLSNGYWSCPVCKWTIRKPGIRSPIPLA